LNWAEIVIAIVAIYGAVIATYNFVIYRRVTSRGIKVTLEYASTCSLKGLITSKTYDEQKPNLAVTITNSGTRPITVQLPFFLHPDNKGKLIAFEPVSSIQFPSELTEGDFGMTWWEGNEIANGLRDAGFSGMCNLVACCKDSVDITYRSKPLKFDINRYPIPNNKNPILINDLKHARERE